jgi:hypothetical protein
MPKQETLYVADGDLWILNALTEEDKAKAKTGELKIVRCRYVSTVVEEPGMVCTKTTLVPYDPQPPFGE